MNLYIPECCQAGARILGFSILLVALKLLFPQGVKEARKGEGGIYCILAALPLKKVGYCHPMLRGQVLLAYSYIANSYIQKLCVTGLRCVIVGYKSVACQLSSFTIQEFLGRQIRENFGHMDVLLKSCCFALCLCMVGANANGTQHYFHNSQMNS